MDFRCRAIFRKGCAGAAFGPPVPVRRLNPIIIA